jgi:hypothetical protein
MLRKKVRWKKKKSLMGRQIGKIVYGFWVFVFVICGSILMGFRAK